MSDESKSTPATGYPGYTCECEQCGAILENHGGSTPCCGALARVIHETPGQAAYRAAMRVLGVSGFVSWHGASEETKARWELIGQAAVTASLLATRRRLTVTDPEMVSLLDHLKAMDDKLGQLFAGMPNPGNPRSKTAMEAANAATHAATAATPPKA